MRHTVLQYAYTKVCARRHSSSHPMKCLHNALGDNLYSSATVARGPDKFRSYKSLLMRPIDESDYT